MRESVYSIRLDFSIITPDDDDSTPTELAIAHAKEIRVILRRELQLRTGYGTALTNNGNEWEFTYFDCEPDGISYVDV